MINRVVTNVCHSMTFIARHHSLSLCFPKHRPFVRCLSTACEPRHMITDTFRTQESHPSQHSSQHLAMFYTIPPELANRLFILGGWDRQQQNAFKTFNETSIMVRSPALEVFEYLKRADYSRPVNRYVFFGPIGSGKTYTLNHILHFGFEHKFLLLYCPNPSDWVRYPEETAQSQHKVERIDTPIDAAVWLQLFRTHNSHLLDELDLRASKQYVWSQREVTEAGDPLKNILEHGINRIKHASDCMAVLIKEIKTQSSSQKFKTLVIVDKVNAFYEKSKIKYPDRSLVDIDNITIARAFKKLFTNDWSNGAVVVSVCKKLIVPYRIFNFPAPLKKVNTRTRRQLDAEPMTAKHLSDLPQDLLTNLGFKDFDPFVPIEVTLYDDKEMESCLNYYTDRKWIQRTAAKSREGRNEIKFLTGFNPLETYEFTSAL
ncbi:28S ribosomal protein S29, mitochondrial-like [Oppia nitens]|uniref:28S ribosomal protein S29, mitochondrial-like n=1 Tax=Oppia nitens TaxID=1686743 RepID=UPI0023DAD3C6|nr:28S ribosomal protein S29, mitochondrial-like [Oppia nitens]